MFVEEGIVVPVNLLQPSYSLIGFICEDTSSNCQAYASYCSNPQYTELLSQNCRLTCGMCGAGCKDETPRQVLEESQ